MEAALDSTVNGALTGQVAGMFAAITGFFAFNDASSLTLPGIAGIILSIGMGVSSGG